MKRDTQSPIKGIKGLPKLQKPGDLITRSNEAIARGLKQIKGTSKRAIMLKGLI